MLIPPQPLSHYQVGLYHQQHYGIRFPANTMLFMLKLRQFGNENRLVDSCHHLLNRYPYLKQTFELMPGGVIAKTNHNPAVQWHDLGEVSTEEKVATIQALAGQMLDPGERLCEFHLIQLNGQETVLMLKWHHMAGDIVSGSIVFKSYLDLLTSKPFRESPGIANYEEFIRWQAEFMHSDRGMAARRYWQDKIDNLPNSADQLPLQIGSGAIEHFEIDSRLTAHIKRHCAFSRLTLAQYFLGQFHRALAGTLRKKPILTMMPINTRPQKTFRETIGYFVNFVPILSRDGEMSEVKQEMDSALKHCGYPFNELYPRSGRQYADLFEHIYKYQDEKIFNYDSGLELEKYGVKEKIVSLDDNLVAYPRGGLSLIISHAGETIKGAFHYNRQRYSSELVAKLGQVYVDSIK